MLRIASFNHRRAVVILAAGALMLQGCGAASLTDQSAESRQNGIQAGSVTATTTADGILLDNQTERVVHYAAVTR
jgi:hypothetical protein